MRKKFGVNQHNRTDYLVDLYLHGLVLCKSNTPGAASTYWCFVTGDPRPCRPVFSTLRELCPSHRRRWGRNARFHLNLHGVRTFDPCGRLIIASISGGECPHLKVDLDLSASPKEPSLNPLRCRHQVLKTPWVGNPIRVVCSCPNYR